MPSDVPRRRLGRLPRAAFACGCTGCVVVLEFHCHLPCGPLGHYINDTRSQSNLLCARAHKCKTMVQTGDHAPPLPHDPSHATRIRPRSPQQAVLACALDRVKIMATRLDHLEMVLERQWYDISSCRRLPSSDRSALVSGWIEATSGVENTGQAVKPAWHCRGSTCSSHAGGARKSGPWGSLPEAQWWKAGLLGPAERPVQC